MKVVHEKKRVNKKQCTYYNVFQLILSKIMVKATTQNNANNVKYNIKADQRGDT